MHGVFPSSRRVLRIFTEISISLRSVLETVGQSLHHSCRSELTRQGISLPLDRQSYSRRLLGVKFKAKTFLLSYSTGQVSVPIHLLYELAETCVFIKQSLLLDFVTTFKVSLKSHSFSRSYGVILPSSFNTVILTP